MSSPVHLRLLPGEKKTLPGVRRDHHESRQGRVGAHHVLTMCREGHSSGISLGSTYSYALYVYMVVFFLNSISLGSHLHYFWASIHPSWSTILPALVVDRRGMSTRTGSRRGRRVDGSRRCEETKHEVKTKPDQV